ncbi:MAG: TolC family protein [Acidobacteriota bacterium]|jgi:outer membrane protein TolC|nr:TolC family protein [Acidobacteriota bacterium]
MNRRFGALLILSALSATLLPAVRQAGAQERAMTLGEAVRLALAHSPDTRIADAETLQAEAALREVRASNLPQAVIGSGAAYNNGFPLSIEGAAPSIFRLEASQPLFSPRNKNLAREAGESAKAARLGADLAGNELAARTALVYAQLDQARKTTELAEARLADARRRQELTEASLAAGRVRPVDAALAKAAVAAARQQLLSAGEDAAVKEAELRELTGIGGEFAIQTVTPTLESPAYDMAADALFEQAAAASPEIRQAEAKIRAKEFHVSAEKAARLPRIVAIGEYAMFSRSNNYEDYYNRFVRNNYLVGVSAQLPLFDGFQSGARVAQGKQEVSVEQLKLQRLRSDLKVNILKGLSAVRVARGAVDAAASDLDAAEAMVEVNGVLLEGGRADEQGVAAVRLDAHQKRLAKLEAEHVLFQRKLELLRVTGSVLSAVNP